MKAIAAMSDNRVIGQGNRIPWHLPEDLKWFRKTTMGHTLLMGRKTFDSIGRVLPGRTTVVMSRGVGAVEGVLYAKNLGEVERIRPAKQDLFVVGGGEIYRETMEYWSDLYLTHVERMVQGDVFFPKFEAYFEPVETVLRGEGFHIVHYRKSSTEETKFLGMETMVLTGRDSERDENQPPLGLRRSLTRE